LSFVIVVSERILIRMMSPLTIHFVPARALLLLVLLGMQVWVLDLVDLDCL